MKVLIVQAGVPYTHALDNSGNYSLRPTLTKGLMHLNDSKFINNTQTREAIANNGADVTYFYYTHRKSIINLIKGSLAIRKMVKENHIDIVNMYWGGLSTFLGALFCPTVFVVSLLGSDLHGSYTPSGRKTFFGKLLSFFSQLTCSYADGVIVMSEKMKQKIWENNRHKVKVIPEGVDLSRFFLIDKEMARDYLQWKMEPPVVLFFNNHSHVKNYSLAKEVFSLVKEKMPEALFKVVSNVQHHQTIWYYNAADVLLLTSLHEGSNNSLKESLACNLPVVSVAAGDAKERLLHVKPSYVSDTYDAAKLAEKLVEILQLKQRSNGQEVVQEIELNKTALTIIQYYHELCNVRYPFPKSIFDTTNSNYRNAKKDELKEAI
ncbi:MAG: glycosyltransferase family 4 protein [Bacteroidota bacterium]